MSMGRQSVIDRNLTEVMCRRVDLPWELGRVILIMARTSLGVTADGGTDMTAVARAIKYASDNRQHLKRPVHTYSDSKSPFVYN